MRAFGSPARTGASRSAGQRRSNLPTAEQFFKTLLARNLGDTTPRGERLRTDQRVDETPTILGACFRATPPAIDRRRDSSRGAARPRQITLGRAGSGDARAGQMFQCARDRAEFGVAARCASNIPSVGPTPDRCGAAAGAAGVAKSKRVWRRIDIQRLSSDTLPRTAPGRLLSSLPRRRVKQISSTRSN